MKSRSEKLLRCCSNMKEIRKKTEGDGELKAPIQSSLKNVTGLIQERFEKLGNSRKYLYSMTDSFLEFRRQGGGFFELESRRHGGVLTIGIPKASGGLRSGISRGYRQVILWAFLFLFREQA